MKINLNLATPVISKVNNSNSTTTNSFPKLSNNLAADTVSFGAKKRYEEKQLDEIQAKFDSSIKPFMQQNKKLYNDVGNIGFYAQACNEEITKKSSEYHAKIYNKLVSENNPNLKNSQVYLKVAEKYSNNASRFSRILDLSEFEAYNSSEELKDEIAKASKIFRESNEVRKLNPLIDVAREAKFKTEKAFAENTIEKVNPDFFGKAKNVSDIYFKAVSFMVLIPYQDAFNLDKKIKETKANLNVPKKVWYEDSKTIEKLFSSEESIIKSIIAVEKEKPVINDFVVEHKNNKAEFPSIEEIEQAYDELYMYNENIYNENSSKVESFFDENYTKKGVKIDLEKIQEELNLQETALKKVDTVIVKLKEEYITKNNKKFYEDNGIV